MVNHDVSQPPLSLRPMPNGGSLLHALVAYACVHSPRLELVLDWVTGPVQGGPVAMRWSKSNDGGLGPRAKTLTAKFPTSSYGYRARYPDCSRVMGRVPRKLVPASRRWRPNGRRSPSRAGTSRLATTNCDAKIFLAGRNSQGRHGERRAVGQRQIEVADGGKADKRWHKWVNPKPA